MHRNQQITFGAYDFMVPTDSPGLGPWLRNASDLLSVTDEAVNAWRASADEFARTHARGLTLGALIRGREALRSGQVLSMHGQWKDSQIMARVIFEWRLVVQFVWLNAQDAGAKAERFQRFLTVEKYRSFQDAKAVGPLRDADVREVELCAEYAKVEAEFPGTLNQKKPFIDKNGRPLSVAGLAKECGLQSDYAAFYGQGSALAHATYWSLCDESASNLRSGS